MCIGKTILGIWGKAKRQAPSKKRQAKAGFKKLKGLERRISFAEFITTCLIFSIFFIKM